MDVLSLFTGIGGFDLAFERAGAKIVQQCEIDARCRELLIKRFNGTQCLEDVRDVRTTSADIICGGFPCQDISTAGKRAGLAGERSGLWWEFARVIDTARPRWVVVENVAALLSSKRGRDMGAILGTLGDLGYGWSYRVLDAQFFGVPQRRRRVFIVGHRGDWRRAGQVLLEPEGGCWNPPTREGAASIAAALTRSGLGGGGPDDNLAQANHLLAFHVTQDPISGPIAPALSTGNQQGCATVGVIHSVALASDPLTAREIAQPLTCRHGDPGVIGASHLGARKLMPIECERLQGFPDGWTEGFADTTRYKMLGNAVAVPVVEWIARRLVSAE